MGVLKVCSPRGSLGCRPAPHLPGAGSSPRKTSQGRRLALRVPPRDSPGFPDRCVFFDGPSQLVRGGRMRRRKGKCGEEVQITSLAEKLRGTQVKTVCELPQKRRSLQRGNLQGWPRWLRLHLQQGGPCLCLWRPLQTACAPEWAVRFRLGRSPLIMRRPDQRRIRVHEPQGVRGCCRVFNPRSKQPFGRVTGSLS